MSRMLIDLTLPISAQLPVWPDDPPVELISAPGVWPRVTRLSLGSHTGTHLDASAHFFPAGATVETLPLETLIGPAWVAHLTGGAPITAARLAEATPAGTTRLLIRTLNSAQPRETFAPDFVALAADAADWLLAHGIRLVGIDAPSIDLPSASDYPVHRALLAHNVVIVENLALSGVVAGACELICLPLPLAGCDGAPARVVVVRSA